MDCLLVFCSHEADASQMLSSWLTVSVMPAPPLLRANLWGKTFIWRRLPYGIFTFIALPLDWKTLVLLFLC